MVARQLRLERTVVLLLLAAGVLVLFWRPLLGVTAFSADDMTALDAPWVEHAPPGYHPTNLALGDTVNYALPAEAVLRHALGRHHFPLWDPYVGLGTPLGASLTIPVLSPFHLLQLLFPLWYGRGISALARLVALVFGTYAFARAIGLRPAAAGVAAASFGFCGFNIAWLAFPHTHVTAALPLAMLLAERVLRRGSLAAVAGLAVATFALLAGAFPFVSVMCIGFVCAYLAVRALVSTPAAPRAQRRHVLLGLGGVVLGLAIGAALLAPLAAELRDADLRYYRATSYSDALPNATALRLIVPNLFGGGNAYFGRINSVETSTWIGLLPLLAAASVPLVRRRSGMAWAFLGAGAVTMAVAYQSPLWHLLRPLPPFSGNPTGRGSSVAAFALAIAAGFAVDAWIRPRREHFRVRARDIGIGTAVLAVFGVGVTAALRALITPHGFAPLENAHAARAEVGWAVVIFAVAVGAALLARAAVLSPSVLAALVVGITLVELVRLGVEVQPLADRRFTLAPATSLRDLPTSGYRVAGVELAGFPNLLGAYGISDMRAHKLPTVEERALFKRLDPVDQPSPTYLRLSPQANFASPWLPLLGVSRVIAPLGQEPIGQVRADVAPASGDTFVLGRGDSLDFTLTGPASGFALYVLHASQHGRVDAYVTPADTARLRAVVTGRDGTTRTTEVGFRGLVALGRVTFMFPTVGPGRYQVHLSWTSPPRSPAPLTLERARAGNVAYSVYRPGAFQVASSSDAVVYGVAGPLPEALLYHDWHPASSQQAIDQIDSGAVDIRRPLLVDRAAPPPPAPGPVPAEQLAVARPDTDRVELRLPAGNAGGMVLLRDAFARGWRVSVDGRPARLVRADAVLRGVAVPAGARRVEFSYVPAGWPAALVVSVLALLAVNALLVAEVVRRRHANRPQSMRTSPLDNDK